MKTNLFKYILIFLLTGLLTNCTDLEEESFTFLSPTNFYRNSDDLQMAVIAVYDGYQNTFCRNPRGWELKLECVTEFASPAYAKNNAHKYNVWSDVNNPDMTVDVWSKSYDIINRANVVLARGEDIEMDQTLKEQMYGEVRFIKGLTLFNLVRLYGGVPVPESMTENLEGLEIPRKTVDETYEALIADLEYAIEKLPAKSSYADSEKWKASKGSAQGILGEVYLTRGSMTGNSEYFTKCKQYCNDLIQSKEYDLEPDFKDLWYWWNTDNENGIESVFEIQLGQYSGEQNTRHIDLGVNITEYTLGSYMYRRFSPPINFYQSYSDDDARKEATFLTKIYKTESGNPSNIIDTLVFVPEDKGFYPGSKGWTTCGPGNLKYYDRTSASAELKLPGGNLYILRYSDVLLNYAEAENELNGATDDAYEKINMVRNRSNLDDLPSGLSQAALSDSIFRERGWEFVGEVQMYFDELRTDRIGDNVKEHVAWGVENGINMYTPLEFVPSKDFLWKIPQYDLDSNPALVQNPDNVSN